MITVRISLGKEPARKLDKIIKQARKGDELEIESLMRLMETGAIGSEGKRRLVELEDRQKFITKNNFLLVYTVRTIGEVEYAGVGDDTLYDMARMGLAKGRPNAD
jgi:hypothetical protein